MDFVSRDEEQISKFPACSGLRQEACLVGHSEDNRQGDDGIVEHFIHHKTRKDLELSATLGCHLCSLAANARWHLYAEISPDDDDDDDEEQQDKKEDEEHREAGTKKPESVVSDPTPPNLFDWVHATITPFDPDYTGTPASKRRFFVISEEGIEVEELDKKSPVLDECQSDIRGKELRKLKSGIWCDIFARHDYRSDHSMTFKEYVPYNNKCASDLSIVRRPGEIKSHQLSKQSSNTDSVVQGLPSYFSQLPISTNSDLSFKIVKDWLTECVQNHSNCRFRTFDLTALPSRLLGVNQGPNDATVRVEDTAALGVGVQYLALSHCWGSVDTIKLTSKSLPRR